MQLPAVCRDNCRPSDPFPHRPSNIARQNQKECIMKYVKNIFLKDLGPWSAVHARASPERSHEQRRQSRDSFFTGKAPYHDGLVSNAGLGATLPSSAAMIDAKQCATWSAVADRAIPDASGSADMRGWRQLVSACQSGLVRNSESREKNTQCHAPLP